MCLVVTKKHRDRHASVTNIQSGYMVALNKNKKVGGVAWLYQTNTEVGDASVVVTDEYVQ